MRNIVLIFFLVISSSALIGQTTLKFSTSCDASNDTSFVIEKLRFYISNITFETKSGELVKDSTIAHLIDMEDSASFTIHFPTIDRNTIQSLHLTFGTDRATNIAGILEGDLDPINGMYWSWNTGYINFKIEGRRVLNSETIPFEYHIGGYLAPFPTEQQASFQVNDLNDSIHINLDLQKLFSQININETPSILIPGKASSDLSKIIQQSFILEK